MEENGKIEITIENEQVNFSTNLSVAEMYYWLDYIKYLIVSGEAQTQPTE